MWVALLAFLILQSCQGFSGSRPNLVVIFIDDTGWGDYSFNDPNRSDTPHMQRLSERGMILSDFHAAASVCTPSRAGLLTGRLGLRTGVTRNFSPYSKAGLPMNETTVAELLSGVGYATAATGKWHLGHRPPHSPVHRGFDAFLGLPMSHDYGCTDRPGYDITCPNVKNDVCRPPKPSLADGPRCHIGPNNPWNESIPLYLGDKIIEQPVDLTTLSDRYVDFAISFLKKATHEKKPFFLYMPFNHMHVPVGNHEPQFCNTSKDRGVYGDTMRQLDSSVGRLVAGLRDAGVENNTLILLTGDNGAPSDQCSYGGLNGPFQGKWLAKNFGGGGARVKLQLGKAAIGNRVSLCGQARSGKDPTLQPHCRHLISCRLWRPLLGLAYPRIASSMASTSLPFCWLELKVSTADTAREPSSILTRDVRAKLATWKPCGSASSNLNGELAANAPAAMGKLLLIVTTTARSSLTCIRILKSQLRFRPRILVIKGYWRRPGQLGSR